MKEVNIISNIYNNIIDGLSKHGKSLIALQGSARSGKTRNSMIFLIQCCLMPEMVNNLMYENWKIRHAEWEKKYKGGLADIKEEPKYEAKSSYHISVVRGSLPVLKRSVFRDDFMEVMLSLGIWDQNRMNKTEMTYTFPNGSIMEFFATDGPEGAQKARGPHRDILFCNEANEIDEENFKQMRMRSYSFVLLDFNPSFTEEHWLFRILHDERTYWFKTTFMDNPYLPTAAREEILSYKYTNPALWQIFGMGEFAIVEGLVFPKDSWDTCDFVDIPIDCHKKAIGLDFGYTHDPSAAVLVFFKNIGNEQHIWVHELMYETGMKEKNIAYRLKQYNDIPKHVDSANPLLLDNLEDNGMKLIYPVNKYALSIQDGVQKMLGYHLHITKSSTSIMKELRNYCWMKDRHDVWTSQPIDKFNHCFTKDTLISMSDGTFKRIIDVKEGDEVVTSQGERRVLKHFRNGRKTVWNVELGTKNGIINIEATPSHKIKTDRGWIELQKICPGDHIFLSKHSMASSSDCIQEKDTIQGETTECTFMCGSFIMDLLRKVITFITKMKIRLTMTYQTLRWYLGRSICHFICKSDCRFLESLKECAVTWTMRESLRMNGIGVQKDENGTGSTLLKWRKFLKKLLASNVESNIVPIVQAGSVQITANQNGEELTGLTTSNDTASYAEKSSSQIDTQEQYAVVESVVESFSLKQKCRKQVYDLMIDDCHEYFANGLLVHNCIDALRYVVMADKSARRASIKKHKISKRRLGL